MNYRLLAAAVILALYAVLAIVLLISSANWTDAHWTHALTVFASFGAMATAAASVLLGVEVQQTNVAAAHRQADEATAQLGALREVHRIALDAAAAPPAPSGRALSPDERLEQVRTLLARTL